MSARNRAMRRSWRGRRVAQSGRGWLPSPKHGTARGVAVWGRPRLQRHSERLVGLLAGCPNLRACAAAHGLILDDHPDSLAALDRVLDPRSDADGRALHRDGGRDRGTVMARHRPGTPWHPWPNGHPVIKLASGRAVDVIAIVSDLADAGQARLAALYADAATGP